MLTLQLLFDLTIWYLQTNYGKNEKKKKVDHHGNSPNPVLGNAAIIGSKQVDSPLLREQLKGVLIAASQSEMT